MTLSHPGSTTEHPDEPPGQLPRRPGPSVRVRVNEHADGRVLPREDRLATEEPLEVRLSWPGRLAHRVGVTMRTPGHDFELAVGLLHGLGVVRAGEVARVAYCTDADLTSEQQLNVVTVSLAGAPPHEPSSHESSSACGVCGTQSIEEVRALERVRAPAYDGPVSSAVLHSLPARLREAQRVFASTGGLHAAGLFEADGTVVLVREDVGRHNAVDKVVGARLLAGQPTAVPLLAVSGRIGFELVQKAVAAGVGAIAAIGAPSSLAVRLAEDAGLCTVGFLRADRFVVYTGDARVGV